MYNLAQIQSYLNIIHFTGVFYHLTGKMFLPDILLIYHWYGKNSRLPTLLSADRSHRRRFGAGGRKVPPGTDSVGSEQVAWRHGKSCLLLTRVCKNEHIAAHSRCWLNLNPSHHGSVHKMWMLPQAHQPHGKKQCKETADGRTCQLTGKIFKWAFHSLDKWHSEYEAGSYASF